MNCTHLRMTLPLLFILTAAARGQEPVPSSADTRRLPAPEITEQKTETLDKGLEKIEDLRRRLSKLGDPTRKEPGEGTEEYLRRVDRILKGRALYIHLLHQQVQGVLEAKFAVESYLEDYRVWSENVARELKLAPERYKRRVIKLEADTRELEDDLVVVAALVHQEAAAKMNQALVERAERFFDQDLLKEVQDRPAHEAKFRDLSLEEKAARLDALFAAIKDSRFEADLLNTTVIKETDAFASVLPKEHAEAIRAMEETLSKKKNDLVNLEDRAAQISILARYYQDTLALVQPDATRLSDRNLQEILRREPQVQKALSDFLSGKTATERAGTADFKTLLKRRGGRANVAVPTKEGMK